MERDMVRLPYEKPEIVRHANLKEITMYSGWDGPRRDRERAEDPFE